MDICFDNVINYHCSWRGFRKELWWLCCLRNLNMQVFY